MRPLLSCFAAILTHVCQVIENNGYKEALMDGKAIRAVIGRNIRQRRQESGISETALAFYLGIMPKQLQEYENGDDSPACDELTQIARVLECSVDDLCSGGS